MTLEIWRNTFRFINAVRWVWPRSLWAACAIPTLLASWFAYADMAVPPLTTRVTDLTATLLAPQQAAIEQTLAEFEKRKGCQIAVLIVSTTQLESIEQYATRVFDRWKLGRKGVDDGVLLLIAKDDRRLRIEIGRASCRERVCLQV
jgi:uncharacterized protein